MIGGDHSVSQSVSKSAGSQRRRWRHPSNLKSVSPCDFTIHMLFECQTIRIVLIWLVLFVLPLRRRRQRLGFKQCHNSTFHPKMALRNSLKSRPCGPRGLHAVCQLQKRPEQFVTIPGLPSAPLERSVSPVSPVRVCERNLAAHRGAKALLSHRRAFHLIEAVLRPQVH